jgi:hypothetical protein
MSALGYLHGLSLLEAKSDFKCSIYHSLQDAQTLISAGLGYPAHPQTLASSTPVQGELDADFPNLGWCLVLML